MQKKKLLDIVRGKIRMKHYSISTERTYAYWIKYFILFHNKKHPIEMAKPDIEQFLTFLAVDKKVSPSTQNQAFSAILFLYKEVLGMDIGLAFLANNLIYYGPVVLQQSFFSVLKVQQVHGEK